MEVDYLIENHGTIFLVCPETADAKHHLEHCVSDNAMWFGNALVVEHRFIGWLWDQLTEEGWVVR